MLMKTSRMAGSRSGKKRCKNSLQEPTTAPHKRITQFLFAEGLIACHKNMASMQNKLTWNPLSASKCTMPNESGLFCSWLNS